MRRRRKTLPMENRVLSSHIESNERALQETKLTAWADKQKMRIRVTLAKKNDDNNNIGKRNTKP